MDKVAKVMRDLGQAQAQARRNKARATAMKRKEEYLGARVPRELRGKVIARANELGIPVSILIRNILEEAFPPGNDTMAGAAAEAGPGVAATASGNVSRTPVTEFPNVIGWEKITLNRPMTCTACGRRIEPGVRVTLGLTSPGEEHVIICGTCKVSD